MKYASNKIPDDYVCGGCGASNCKLWRQYNTFLDRLNLLCATCAGKDQDKDVSTLDSDGRYIHAEDLDQNGDILEHRTDSIGWLVPAVPTEEGDTYWHYTSVPDEGVDWWRQLPTWPNRGYVPGELGNGEPV